MKKVATFSVFLLFLNACASTDKKPEWLDHASTHFPAQQYLHAIGEADNRDTAADRARANLAKIFAVAINDRSLDFSQAHSVTEANKTAISNEQKTSRFVSSEAQQVLEGSEIVEYWQDPQSRIFSLAVLNKSAAANRFSSEIRRADQQTRDLVNYANHQAGTAVASLRALEQARQLQHQRNNNNRNLSIVSHKVFAADYPMETLEKMLRERIAMLSFSIKSPQGELDKELANAINHLGIEQADNSTYVLRGKLDHNGIERKQGWYWQRGSLVLSLSWQGNIIAKQRWPYKVSAMDENTVAQRGRDLINHSLSKNLYELLTQQAAAE